MKRIGEFKIRQATKLDNEAIRKVILAAYKDVAYSNKREHIMVERLRNSDAIVPELSLVAEDDNNDIVGHILLTRIRIQNHDNSFEGLALAPLSIIPEFQNMGIGGKLIIESHAKAKLLGYKYIVVLGHPDYYPRFGYERASTYGIQMPVKVNDANSMIISLVEKGLSDVSGLVEFSTEFFE